MRDIINSAQQRFGTFPFMGNVFQGWDSSATFCKVIDTIVAFENVKTEKRYQFKGVFQPMSSRDLNLKPEGARAWKWFTMWTRAGIEISVGDIIEDGKGVRYKVMRENNWEQAGYGQYDILEDYVEHE